MENEKVQEKSNAYLIHKLIAVVLDILVVVLFVVIGSKEHDQGLTFSYGLLIGLPFVASFFAVQAVVSKDMRSIKNCVIAAVISVPIAIAIRVNLPRVAGREEFTFKPVFAVISLIFLTFGWTLWRFILLKVRGEQSK